MASGERTVRVYEELADWHDRQGQAQKRDRFLLLAADAALSAGNAAEAERFRGRLLEVNPHHLLRPYRSFTEALHSPDVGNYVSDLRQTHHPDDAERLLRLLRNGDASPQNPERTASSVPEQASQPSLDASRVAGDAIKVFRLRIEEEGGRLAGPAAQLPPPSPKPGKLAAAQHSPARPSSFPSRPTGSSGSGKSDNYPQAPVYTFAHPKPHESPVPDEDDSGDLAWVASALFWIVLSVGLLFAAYVMLRPLWPG